MRKIKFRAWDVAHGKMFEPMSLRDIVMSEIIISYGEKNIVWEQFVGICDKNRKEVYEGDICNYWHTDGERTGCHRRLVVAETETGPTFKSITDAQIHENIHPAKMMELMRRASWGNDDIYAVIEVIGNVHETPELLKEGK